jgi:probable phosphoglycerate mutase
VRHGATEVTAEDPFTFAPQRGESGLSVLVVSHKATLRLVIRSLLGFDARGYRDRLGSAPASLNIMEFRDPVRARLVLFNDISHDAEQPHRPADQLAK